MNLLLRQIWALVRKNLLLICVRRPVSTFIRAFALPLVIVLVLAYSKNFFASPQTWGVSNAHNVSTSFNRRSEANTAQIRSLAEGLAATKGRDIVGFIDNGMTGGDVGSVIDSLSTQVRDAGRTAKQYRTSWDLAQDCRTDTKGSTKCYGAVIFYSSPSQGTNMSSQGVWNYVSRPPTHHLRFLADFFFRPSEDRAVPMALL
jgi:ATP-binding cassette subfamily A (ABC1) protein 3